MLFVLDRRGRRHPVPRRAHPDDRAFFALQILADIALGRLRLPLDPAQAAGAGTSAPRSASSASAYRGAGAEYFAAQYSERGQSNGPRLVPLRQTASN